MRLETALAVGAVGGHGAVKYHCTQFVPQRLIEFTFDEVAGRQVDGHHAFEFLSRSGGTLVRHTVDAEVPGRITAWWFRVFVEPTHNVVVEEIFDTVEELATGRVCRPSRWSPWVRLLRYRRGLPTRPTPYGLDRERRS
ncbi:hypothetical protein [Mycobacterium sp. NPDC004974]